jgi:hypothetical protein
VALLLLNPSLTKAWARRRERGDGISEGEAPWLRNSVSGSEALCTA